MKHFGTVGIVGRFKPLHNGAVLMLRYACENSKYVKIGIGSSNKYNLRNPFTPEETKDMIDAYLKPRFDNYEIIFIPDFGHIPGNETGKPWKEYLISHFGKLDAFVTGNPYVEKLLGEAYRVIHPKTLISKHDYLELRATIVRMKMARNEDYSTLVPKEVHNYIESHNLSDRFRKEFGKETIATSGSVGGDSDKNCIIENLDEERNHAKEK